MRTLQAEAEQLRGRDRARDLEAVGASTAAPLFGVPPESRPAPAVAETAEPARERAAVLDQLARLQKENSRLRQWLANIGIHLG